MPRSEDPTRSELPDSAARQRAEEAAKSSPDPERFESVREIARGGMGRVVEVFDRRLGRTVAIKLSLDDDLDPVSRARFEREVAITARLEHPSIVPVYDAGVTASGEPYYVMRNVTGAPLDERVQAATTLDQRLLLLPNVLAIADAMAHAHQRGVIHRDLKPSNVLLGALGETVVIDWGLAKLVDEQDLAPAAPAAGERPATEPGLTTAGVVIGTPGFMAPEQVTAGATDARSDVYALGACLFYVLAGEPPLFGREEDVFARTVAGKLPSLAALVPGVPPDLVSIVDTAMARAPDARYRDAAGFAEELRRFLGGQLVASHRYSTRARFARWLRRYRAPVIALGIGVLVAVAVAVVSLRRVLDARARTEAALDGERDRGDELVVAQAVAYLDSDPTRAVATLAQLRPDSPRWATLGPVLADARARGIAYAFPGQSAQTWTVFAPGPGPARILTSGGGSVQLHDLEARTTTTLLEERTGLARGWWAGELVVATATMTQEPVIIDPRSGARAPFGWTHKVAQVTAAPGLVVALDEDHHVVTLEVDALPITNALTELPDVVGDYVTLSPSGHWLLVRTKHATRLFQRDAHAWTLAHTFDEEVGAEAFEADEHSYVYQGDQMTAVTRFDLVTMTERTRWPTHRVLFNLAIADGMVYGLAVEPLEVARFESDGRIVSEVAVDSTRGQTLQNVGPVTAIMASPREIVLGIPSSRRSIRPPLDLTGIAGDPRGRWLVGMTASEIFVWDLDHVLPAEMPVSDVDGLVFVDNTSLLMTGNDGARQRSLALVHLAPQGFAFASKEPLPPVDITNHVFAVDGVGYTTDLLGDVTSIVWPSLPGALTAARAPSGATITGTAAGAIESRVGSTITQLAMLGSPISHVVATGEWVAASTRSSVLWRRGPDGHVDQLATELDGDLVCGHDGTLYFSHGTALRAWLPGSVAPVDIATFKLAIARVQLAIDDRIGIESPDGTFSLVDHLTHDVRVVVRPATGQDAIRHLSDGGAISVMELRGGLAAIELRTAYAWVVARGMVAQAVSVSPDGNVAIAVTRRDGASMNLLRFLIDRPPTTVAWIRSMTNAVAPTTAGGELEWTDLR